MSVFKYVRIGDDIQVGIEEVDPLELQAIIWGLLLAIPIRDRFAVLQRIAGQDAPELPQRIARQVKQLQETA